MEPNSQECLPLGLATGYWDGLSGDRMRRGTIRLQTLNYQLNHFSVKRSSLLFDVNHTPQRETKLNVAEMAAQRRGLCFRLPVVESSTYCTYCTFVVYRCANGFKKPLGSTKPVPTGGPSQSDGY
ncbi:hypothetical protein E4U31_002178 [Claviceps sp. LM219 group G6]|nr:hypothetical protein E4U31_002178 [Claviceps sp. LM219 group G6]